MKKFSVFISSIILVAAMTGCSVEKESEGIDYVDDEVISVIADGLEKRWDYVDAEDYDKDMTLDKAIQIEIDGLDGYKDAKYEDTKLQELVLSYINALNDSMDIWNLYDKDEQAREQWESIYNKRSQILKSLVNDYGMTVDAKYEKDLDDMVNNATAVERTEEQESAIEDLVSKIQFEKIDEIGSYETYAATVTNDTSLKFDYFSLSIPLYDDGDVRIDTENAMVSQWEPGETVVVEFMTDKAFSSYKVLLDSYTLGK